MAFTLSEEHFEEKSITLDTLCFPGFFGHCISSRFKVGKGKNRESVVRIQATVDGGFDQGSSECSESD